MEHLQPESTNKICTHLDKNHFITYSLLFLFSLITKGKRKSPNPIMSKSESAIDKLQQRMSGISHLVGDFSVRTKCRNSPKVTKSEVTGQGTAQLIRYTYCFVMIMSHVPHYQHSGVKKREGKTNRMHVSSKAGESLKGFPAAPPVWSLANNPSTPTQRKGGGSGAYRGWGHLYRVSP